VQFLYYEM